MRIIPFPSRAETDAEQAWIDALDAALSGAAPGPAAEDWRELREDVRALTPPLSPEFERELAQRIAARRTPQAPPVSGGRRPAWIGWLANHRPLVAELAGAVTVLVAVALIVIPGGGVKTHSSAQRTFSQTSSLPKAASADKAAAAPVTSSAAVPSVSSATPSSASPSSASANRLQQRAASVSLGPPPAEVQAVADRVARLAASVGGFVRSSHVQVQQEGSSGAELTLSIPSAKLDGALASLGQIAPLRAESQSAQDITDSYEAAKRRLSDLNAERQALLRALSAASTQGQIDSLRERLSGVSRAIAQAQTQLQSVARQGATSEVEVTVQGSAQAASKSSTLQQGLDKAGHVLLVTLTVLLIAAAVLVPLVLLIALGFVLRRALRSYRRERVLGAR